MTFEEWYEWYNPDLNRLGDDCLDELISAFETGRKLGFKEGYEAGRLEEEYLWESSMYPSAEIGGDSEV